MADQVAEKVENLELEDEQNLNYKAPAKKTLEEIANQDANDESLVKYSKNLKSI